jgi:sulfur relay (sulfurtransferase) DsrC/TusE family protein
LNKAYNEYGGEPPARPIIEKLAQELTLSEDQIYKWFWDTKKKLAKSGNQTHLRDEVEWDTDFETLAQSLDIQIEEKAQQIVACASPTMTRKIVKHVVQDTDSSNQYPRL